MNRRLRVLIVLSLVATVTGSAIAQLDFQRRRGGYGRGGGRFRGEVDIEQVDRNGVPVWEIDKKFKSDVFTFARVKYASHPWGRGGGWWTDFPDSDLNFSYRLQELTSLEVNPFPVILELTDPRIYDFPFLYMIEPGRLELSDDEVLALRRYCLNGGFLMVDDFWGDDEWDNFHENIKRVFPDREPQELPLEHEIFHCVYDLKMKPQVPSIHAWERGFVAEGGPDTEEPHYRAIFDDKGRMMSLICHNTDLGDGWEREGENHTYFKEFAEKWSYPMGINTLTYAMTH